MIHDKSRAFTAATPEVWRVAIFYSNPVQLISLVNIAEAILYPILIGARQKEASTDF
jgi:hypothetical protein